MDSILKEINAVSGVSGSFVCDETGEVMASAMPSVFDAETTHTVGRTAAQTLSSLQMARRRKIGEMDLVYAGGRVIVKAMPRGYLIVLCIRNVNVPLLNLIANMALKRLATAMSKPRENTPAPQPVRPAQPVSQAAPAAVAPSSSQTISAAPAPTIPPTREESLSTAIPALAGLTEALIQGAAEMGVGRTTLMTILEPRYRAIMPKYRFLNEQSFAFGKLNSRHLAGAPPVEAAAALGELIGEIYHSASDLLGPDRVKSLYRQACLSVMQKNGTALQLPAVQKILPQAIPPTSQPAPQAQNGSLSSAVPGLVDLAEELIEAAHERGIERATLLTILDSGYRALVPKYNFLNESSFALGKLNASHFTADGVPPAQAVEALGELIGEIYRIESKLLGPDRAKALYQQAYQSVTQKDGTVLQQQAVKTILPVG
jgi:predicted regulator of Ras-like GTPase activity (Roadblock/LC7/MglB family)